MDAHSLRQLLLLAPVVALAINATLFAQMSIRGVKMWFRWTVFVTLTAVLFGIMGEILRNDWISAAGAGLIVGIAAATAVDRRKLIDLFRR